MSPTGATAADPDRILVFAPAGIGEVRTGEDLVAVLLAAADADPDGPLRDGDVLVLTSKVVSKAEGRRLVAADREDAIGAETIRTVARRGPTRIVLNAQGLVQAAAGVDASNVEPGTVLLLPADPDASAAHLREGFRQHRGIDVGVVLSDTSGRAWRHGQTDLAVGAAGVLPLLDLSGHHDPYGNELKVTSAAVADELAAAGDLVKAKLARRPLAVVRGLAHLVVAEAPGALSLSRTGAEDMFARGSREAVLHALLLALGRAGEYERLVQLAGAELRAAVLTDHSGETAALVGRLLESCLPPSG